jgi:putative acyl-CoA dehydrogenase
MALALQGRCWCATDTRPSPGVLRLPLAGDHGRAFGTLPPGIDYGAIIERARPLPAGH